MILPTKRLSEERALIRVGAEILGLLTEPKTVSRLWNEIKDVHGRYTHGAPLTYDWFVLALDFLYILNTVDLEDGRIRRKYK
ncbi:ABC-three component system middle component 6 [Alicyclobacillus kakegawensis]|uniref:ABC-three component system middle component 6 n=1 Tax=Alicyclobacillus kakegawensis TaxID=392012 RepID=UPI00082BDE5E|nr:ABC-three component system middle component 6 [Alicyclobacillus kakegawensis]